MLNLFLQAFDEGLDHRRPRQARLSQRRHRDHDVEHRVGALPQADQPAGVPTRSRSASSRSRGRSRASWSGGSRRSSATASTRSVIFAPLTKDEVRADRGAADREDRGDARAERPHADASPPGARAARPDGYSLAYGARFLKRVIEDRIKLPISQLWAEGHAFVADVRDGQVEIEVERRRGRLSGARRDRLSQPHHQTKRRLFRRIASSRGRGSVSSALADRRAGATSCASCSVSISPRTVLDVFLRRVRARRTGADSPRPCRGTRCARKPMK